MRLRAFVDCWTWPRAGRLRRRAGSGRGAALLFCATLAGAAAGLAPSESFSQAGAVPGVEEGGLPTVMGPPPMLAPGIVLPGGAGTPARPVSVEGGMAPVTGPPPSLVSPEASRAQGGQAGASGVSRTPAVMGGVVPSGVGRPGRQEFPPSAAPALPAVLLTFECPREAIARLIASAVEEGEFSEALELEREVLVLCRDRQAILKELVSSELELAAALQKSAAARAQEALKIETARREADAKVEAAREAILEAARAEIAQREAAAVASVATAAKPVAVKEKAPEYGWFGMSGSGEDLRANVTDGTSVWRVRAGDRLPGGVRIVAVEARPPGVTVKGWTADRLPYRPRSGR